MFPPSAYNISYANRARQWTQHLASTTWALYTPSHELLHSNDICLGSATNNQEEYVVVIGLLIEAIRQRNQCGSPMENASVNNKDSRLDMRHGGKKRRLKTLQMCTKKKPSVEWLCLGVKLL